MSNFLILCQTFEVTPFWASQRRVEYLSSDLEIIGDEIKDATEDKNKALSEIDKLLSEKWFKGKVGEYRKMENKINYWKNPNGKISDEDIRRAREYPIGELLNIKKKGNVCCPFHNDKNPSASIKNNKLHCFTCNETWSSLDYIIKKDGRGFIEAVVYLNGKE